MKKLLFMLLFSSIAWGQVTVVQAPVPKFRSFTPSGLPNVGGCVYTYASGTSTPQATYTDSTGLFANSNPVILDANGEAPIWITSAVYRFQVWSFGSGVIGSNCGNGTQLYQIDGVRDTGLNALNGPLTIAPTTNGIDILSIIRATDVSPSGNFVNFKSFAGATLFKVDISGNLTAVGGAFSGAVSGTTGTFTGAISGTTGAFTGGVLTLTEVAPPSAVAGSDIVYAELATHRLKFCNNGGPCNQVVASGNDVNTSDAVTALHFGATQEPLSGTAPTTSQFLQFNGTNIVGSNTLTTPTIAGGGLIAGGTAAGLSGTGACSTITTQLGGAWAGTFKCTGTTGASVITITPGITAPNGFVCVTSDITAGASGGQGPGGTNTTCKIQYGSITSNDVISFAVFAF